MFARACLYIFYASVNLSSIDLHLRVITTNSFPKILNAELKHGPAPGVIPVFTPIQSLNLNKFIFVFFHSICLHYEIFYLIVASF